MGQVALDSSADRAGIQAGDILLSINGNAVRDIAEVWYWRPEAREDLRRWALNKRGESGMLGITPPEGYTHALSDFSGVDSSY